MFNTRIYVFIFYNLGFSFECLLEKTEQLEKIRGKILF